jgi:hypothetical protein
MTYPDLSVGSVYTPKLLGSYERELTGVIEELTRLNLARCVDVGAAEGYYAVGLARLLGCPVTCFEIEPAGRELIRQMADANGVAGRLTILGRCDPAGLQEILGRTQSQRTFVLCDVEGYEDALLDPGQVPALRQCWLLVEIHEFAVRGVGGRLTVRFQATHDVTVIREQPRTPADFPNHPGWARVLPARFKVRLMQEGRPERMSWLWMAPRDGGASVAGPGRASAG